MAGDIALTIAFFVLAAVTMAGALAVVTVRNLFHAALFLALTFVSVAGLYITLQADFLGIVQILVYAGAIAVLMVFAIMLTYHPEQGSQPSSLRASALIVSLLLAVVVIWVVVQTAWPLSNQAPLQETVPALADAFFNQYLLPFEVASLVLLAAMVGAIVLAREDQP